MDVITILLLSKIAADVLLQTYYDLFTKARMQAKRKKSQSLSLVGGSVRGIHFKIGDDTVLTVREKSDAFIQTHLLIDTGQSSFEGS